MRTQEEISLFFFYWIYFLSLGRSAALKSAFIETRKRRRTEWSDGVPVTKTSIGCQLSSQVQSMVPP
jgi:hypothetical protein